MTNITAPKMPDGDKVDFDVSPYISMTWNHQFEWDDEPPLLCVIVIAAAGHVQEASGEGSGWAAVSYWGSLCSAP